MKIDFSGKKIALVADWLTSRGGAERVFLALMELFPEADIFTSVYNATLFPECKERKVYTTYLQRLPRKIRQRHQILLPLLPGAFSRLDLSKYDLIITSCSAFSKCVKKGEGQTHICYCHTPVRYLYHAREEYIHTYPLPFFFRPLRLFLPWILNRIEKKDQASLRGVDFFLANSDYVKERIKKYYHREAYTLYPCINTNPFLQTQKEKKGYFLAVGRFIPYKKFDLLIETFKQNGLPLKLVGIGPELGRCKLLAKGVKNIEFLGFAEDKALTTLYADARAFLFPAEEDFGLTPIEAMASGTPVIYYDKGGATESVGEWGVRFHTQTAGGLQQGIDDFLARETTFRTEELRARAKEFDQKRFQEKFLAFLNENIYTEK